MVVAVASVEPIWPWVEGPAEAARVQAHADRVAAIAREFGIFLSVGPTPPYCVYITLFFDREQKRNRFAGSRKSLSRRSYTSVNIGDPVRPCAI